MDSNDNKVRELEEKLLNETEDKEDKKVVDDNKSNTLTNIIVGISALIIIGTIISYVTIYLIK